MAKLGHNNLFNYGDASEVYEGLQRDFDRDTWVIMFWEGVIIACAIGASYLSHHDDWLWILSGIYASVKAIDRFVDNSNRNWAMHIMDFMNARQAKRDVEP